MDVQSWLDRVESGHLSDVKSPEYPRILKRKRHQQIPTPSASTLGMDSSTKTGSLSHKRLRPDEQDDVFVMDSDRTPRGHGKAWSNSDRSGARSSLSDTSSRTSPTKRLARLEIAPEPVIVKQISWADARMPTELKLMLKQLDTFHSRCGIVPDYLADEIRGRADEELYNFTSNTFTSDSPNSFPKLSLAQVMEVVAAGRECFEENHPEASWNVLVHWPVFRLALGPIVGSHQRVRAMPCTTARLRHMSRGGKMVDFCMFVEPHTTAASQVEEFRQRLGQVNHTDFHPLRNRPLALSAESKRPGEGFRDAQLQLGIWQAAQWNLLESQLAGQRSQLALISFLPALIIQGHEWYFAATTKSNSKTVCSPLPCILCYLAGC